MRQALYALALAVGLLASEALAQKLPHPQAIALDAVAQTLSDAQLPVSVPDLLEAYRAHLDGYSAALAQADADFAKLCEQTRATPGALLSPNDTTKYLAIEERAQQAELALCKALMDRLAAGAAGKEAEVATASKLLEIRAWYAHFRGGLGSSFILLIPDDASLTLASSVRFSGEDKDVAEALARKASLAHLDDRLSAVRDLAKSLRNIRMDVAKFAEKNGIVGKTRNEVGALDGQAMNEAARAKDPEKWDQDAYEAARAQSLHPTLDAMASGSTADPSAWLKLVRAEFAAFQAIEAELPAHTMVSMEQTWLPWLIQGMGATLVGQLPMPQGAWAATPADYAHMLMRIEGLSDEVRQQLRDIGLAWMKDDRVIVRTALDKSVQSGTLQRIKDDRIARAQVAIAQVSEVLGAPEMVPKQKGAQAAFPKVTLKNSLSADEEPLYGRRRPTAERPAAPVGRIGSGTRVVMRPVGYPADYADKLAARLRLNEVQRATLTALVSDARLKWDKDIEPLIAKSDDPIHTMGGQTHEQQLEYARELIAAAVLAEDAYKAAIAFDVALIESIRAALGPTVDSKLLDIELASRRTAEAVRANSWRVGAKTQAQPVDVPAAVLNAPLSPDGRNIAVAVLAPLAQQWLDLGRTRQEATRRGSLINHFQYRGLGFEEGTKLAAEGPAHEEKSRQIDKAWSAAESEATKRILNALSPDDASIWRRWVQRCQWPSMYPNLEACEYAVAQYMTTNPPEPDAQRVSAILAAIRGSAEAFGDLSVQAMQAANPPRSEEEKKFGDLDSARDRLDLFSGLIPWYEAVATEQLRAALPEQSAAGLPRTRATYAITALQVAK